MGDERGAHPALTMIGSVAVLGASFLVESPHTMTYLLAFTLVSFSALEYQRSRNVLSPVIMVAGVFGWLYVAKPLYVLEVRSISSGTSADAVSLAGHWDPVLCQALTAVMATFCALCVAFQWAVARPGVARKRPAPVLDGARYSWVVFAVVAVDVLAFAVLVLVAGGVGAYVEGLALRSESLAGLSFLTLATAPLNLTLLIGTTARFRGDPEAPTRGTLVLLGAVALTSAFLTGGRASILAALLLPLLVVVHYARRRIGPVKALLTVGGALALFVSLGALLRDSTFQQASGLGPWHFVRARFDNLHESLVGGVEAVPYDSLVRLVAEREFNALPLQEGATYRAIATWPVPRAFWAEKPAGGGNAWFTETYVPRFYGDAKVESSISFVGENYANFGWAGVVVGGVLLGLILGLLHARIRTAQGVFALPLYAVLMGFLMPMIRGDAYHNVTSVVFAVAVWFALRQVLGRPRPRPCRARAHRHDACSCPRCHKARKAYLSSRREGRYRLPASGWAAGIPFVLSSRPEVAPGGLIMFEFEELFPVGPSVPADQPGRPGGEAAGQRGEGGGDDDARDPTVRRDGPEFEAERAQVDTEFGIW